MLTGPYFKPFLGTLNLANYTYALPFQWDEAQKKVVLITKKSYVCVTFTAIFVSVSYLFVLVHQLLSDYSQMTAAITTILSMWLTINLGTAFSKVAIQRWQCEMKDFFNNWMKFEEKYFAGEDAKERGVDPSVLIVLRLTYISVAIFPLAVFSYIGLQPCTPPFITSFILQCKDPSELEGFFQLARFLLAVAEGIFWFHIVGMAAFLICFLQYLSQKCLKTYLSDLRQLYGVSNVNRKVQQRSSLLHQANIYRQIQILHGKLHEIVRFEILPMAQTVWMSISIIALYTTIKFSNVIGFPLYFFFPMCAIDGGVFFFVVTGAASQSYEESCKLLHKTWRIRKHNGDVKWFRKFKMSCKELRTYVGTVGFLDKTTPLAIIHFCLAQTGGLLLMGH